MTVLTLFAFRFGRMVRWLAGREVEGPWRGGQGRDEGLELVWSWFGGIAETVISCNSPGTRIGLPGPSRAHSGSRWNLIVLTWALFGSQLLDNQ